MNNQPIAVSTFQFGFDAHIDNIYIRRHVPCDGIDAGPADEKRLDHGTGHFLGICTDAFVYNSVIAGHHQNRFTIYGRLHGFLDCTEPLGNIMQSSQGTGRHDQRRSSLRGFSNPIPIQGLDTFDDVLQLHNNFPP